MFAVLTSLAGSSTPIGTNPITIDSATIRQVEDKRTIKDIDNLMSTEQYVREYFKDIPIMIEVAKCESHFRQLNSDGDIKRGQKNPADVGVMQINEHYHLDESAKKDYNIYTLEGNTAYARKLYNEKGTDPWKSSRSCWNKNVSRELAFNVK